MAEMKRPPGSRSCRGAVGEGGGPPLRGAQSPKEIWSASEVLDVTWPPEASRCHIWKFQVLPPRICCPLVDGLVKSTW